MSADTEQPAVEQDPEVGIVVSAVADVVSSIPEPVRKNAIKAFGQLCSAAVDIPVAWLEGIAAEKRAVTQARISLIETSASQMAAEVRLPPQFAEAAAFRFGQKIVRQQINLDRVTAVAADQLKNDSFTGPVSDEPINDDWLNSFEREASEKGTQEMQRLFGKILAGEIKKPKSFSLKTIRLIGQLDAEAANIFQTFCSMAIALLMPDRAIRDVRVCSLGKDAAKNALKDYGLGFQELNVLHEHGLIIPDYNSWLDYVLCISREGRKVRLPLLFQNHQYGLSPEKGHVHTEFKIHGTALTKAGQELFPIVDIMSNEAYATAFRQFLNGHRLTLEHVTNPI